MSHQFEVCGKTLELKESSSLNNLTNLTYNSPPYMDYKTKSSDGLNTGVNIKENTDDIFNNNHNNENNNNNNNNHIHNKSYHTTTVTDNTTIPIYHNYNETSDNNNKINKNNKNDSKILLGINELARHPAIMDRGKLYGKMQTSLDYLQDMFMAAEQNNIILKMAMMEGRNEKMALQKQIEHLENLNKQQELNMMRAVHQHQLWSDSLRKELVVLQEEKDEAVRDYELVMSERKEVHIEMKQLNGALKHKNVLLEEAKQRISMLEKLLKNTHNPRISLDTTSSDDNVARVKIAALKSKSDEMIERGADEDVAVCSSDNDESYASHNAYESDTARIRNRKNNKNNKNVNNDMNNNINKNSNNNNNNNKIFENSYYMEGLLEQMKILKQECSWLRGEKEKEGRRHMMLIEENRLLKDELKRMVDEEKVKDKEIGKIRQELEILKAMQALKNQNKINQQKIKKSPSNNNRSNIKNEINNENYKNKTKITETKSKDNTEAKLATTPTLNNSFYSKDSAIDSDNQVYGSPLHQLTLPSNHLFQLQHPHNQPPSSLNFSSQQRNGGEECGKIDPIVDTSSENEKKVTLNVTDKNVSDNASGDNGTKDINSDNKDETKSSGCGYDRDFEDGSNNYKERDDFNYFAEDDNNFSTMLNLKDFSGKYGTFNKVKNEIVMNISNKINTKDHENNDIDNSDSMRQTSVKNPSTEKDIVGNKTKYNSSNFVRHSTWPKHSQLDWSSSNDEDDRECCYYGNKRFNKNPEIVDIGRGNKSRGVCARVDDNHYFKRDFSMPHTRGNMGLTEKYANEKDANNNKHTRRVRSSLRENSKLKRLFLFKNKRTISTGKNGEEGYSDEVGAEDNDGGVGDEDDYWRRLYKRNMSVRLMKMCRHCRRIVRKKGVLNGKYNNDEDDCNVKNKKPKKQWESSINGQKHHPCHRIQLSDSVKDFMKPMYKEMEDERKDEEADGNTNNEDNSLKISTEKFGLKENRNSFDEILLKQINQKLQILSKSPSNDVTTKALLPDKDPLDLNLSEGAVIDLIPSPLDRGNGARSSLTLMKDFLKDSSQHSQQPVQPQLLQEAATNDFKQGWQLDPSSKLTQVSSQQQGQSFQHNNQIITEMGPQLPMQLAQPQTLFKKNHQKPFFVQPKFQNLSTHLQPNTYPSNIPNHQANNNFKVNDSNSNFLNLFRLEKHRMKKLKLSHKQPFLDNDKNTSSFYYNLSDYDESIDKPLSYASNFNNSDVESLTSSFTSSSNSFLLSSAAPFKMPPSLPSTPLSHIIYPPSLILSSPPSSPPPSSPPPILPSTSPPHLVSPFNKNNFNYTSVSLNKLNSNEIHKNRLRPGETRNITLKKNIEAMGFSIRSSSLGGIFVSYVGENSPASQAGFEVGDQLLEVCGINMRGASETVANKVLHQVEGTVNLLVQYNPQKYAESMQTKTQSDVTQATNQEEKRVVKISNDVVSKGLSFNVAGGNVVGVFVDGVGQEAEKLKVKDRIVEYNRKSFQGLTLEEAMEELQRPNQNASFVVCYDPIGYEQMLNKPGDCVYLRAMFCHQGTKAQELSFNKGDIILLENTYYQQEDKQEDNNTYNYHNQDKEGQTREKGKSHSWWAHRVESVVVASGFIDPCVFYHKQCSDDQNTASLPVSKVTTSPTNDRKSSRSKTPQNKPTNTILSKSSSNSSFRKSLFQRFRSTGSFSKDGAVEEEEDEEEDENINKKYDHKYLGFEQVYKLHADDHKRPVILVGPFSPHIISKLVSESRDKFTEYIPEFTKSKTCDSSEHSKIEFIDSMGCSQHISVPSLKRLMSKNYHCLLSAPLRLVACLHTHRIYPIVLFVKFKSYKQIRQVRQSMYQPDKTSGKQARLMFEQAAELEKQYKHLFSDVITGEDNLASVCFKVKGAIDEQQQNAIWLSQQSLAFFKQ